jgi:hypothetical protein
MINAAIKTMRASIGRAAPLVEERDLGNLRCRAERNVRRESPTSTFFTSRIYLQTQCPAELSGLYPLSSYCVV